MEASSIVLHRIPLSCSVRCNPCNEFRPSKPSLVRSVTLKKNGFPKSLRICSCLPYYKDLPENKKQTDGPLRNLEGLLDGYIISETDKLIMEQVKHLRVAEEESRKKIELDFFEKRCKLKLQLSQLQVIAWYTVYAFALMFAGFFVPSLCRALYTLVF